jgi:hypothetical protein
LPGWSSSSTDGQDTCGIEPESGFFGSYGPADALLLPFGLQSGPLCERDVRGRLSTFMGTNKNAMLFWSHGNPDLMCILQTQFLTFKKLNTLTDE